MNNIKEDNKMQQQQQQRQQPPPPITITTPTISRNRNVDPNNSRKSFDKTTPHKDHATKISNSTNTYQLGKHTILSLLSLSSLSLLSSLLLSLFRFKYR